MLWIVGPAASDYREYLDQHAIEYGQFMHAGTRPYSKEVLNLDFTDTTSLLASLSSLKPRPLVSAVIVTGIEPYVVPAAHIAEFFSVPGLPLEAARAATDKIIMRQKFEAYDPAITPAFQMVHGWQDVESFFAAHEGPVMLKPANLMKSLFVTRNRTLDELRKNYEYMTSRMGELYTSKHLGKPRIVIESCMEGNMHTVAGFVDNNGDVQLVEHAADCITAAELGIDDAYLYSRSLPTRLPAKREQSVFAVTKAGVAALGLRNTPIHAELILTVDGPKIIEIGARLGGFRPRMYEQAYGLDLLGGALNIAYGKPVNINEALQNASTVIELFPEHTGAFTRLEGTEVIKNLPSFVSLKAKTMPGEVIGKASEGFRAAAIINLAGDAQQVAADTMAIRDKAKVQSTTI